jgi:glycosidase
MKYRFAILACTALLLSCAKEVPKVELKPAPKNPPQWAKEAIWYQITVERFHNADLSNDPTISDIQGSSPGYIPDTWSTTKWIQDWYKKDIYFDDMHGKTDLTGSIIHSFDEKIALRRYGGDLQGVINKLDYLESLGINAIYFTPINDSPSFNKHDARHWRHVDVNFGPDPSGDKKVIASEDPADPSSWQMTSADLLFFELIKQTKARGIRVIIDYSWEYTGHTFWAWQDVIKNQRSSAYVDWFNVKQFDDPDTGKFDFEYQGYSGNYLLPEIQKTTIVDKASLTGFFEANIKSEAAKKHIFAVTRRYLDPNGDGDPSDGVDGFKLDANKQTPLGFLREYRTYVKSINPQALLVGTLLPNQAIPKPATQLVDKQALLQGDTLDALMNFDWYQTARQYFMQAGQRQQASEFVEQLKTLHSNISSEYQHAIINMSAGHNAPRLLTSLFNKEAYQFDGKAGVNNKYLINKPNLETVQTAKLLLVHQFTYLGAPQIWAGDEMGMWGSAYPHNSKPLMWPEYSFENQSPHPLGKKRPSDEVKFNQELFDFYQFMVKLRRANPVLTNGAIEFPEQNNSEHLLSYRRFNQDENAYIVFNKSNKRQQIIFPASVVDAKSWQLWDSSKGADILQSVPSEQYTMSPESVIIVLTK